MFFHGEDSVDRQPVAVHRRRPARGAEVLPRHPAGRRGAPRGVLQPLHARGGRARRRHDRRRAGGDQAGADLGLREDVRDARPRGRRAAARPLAHQARAGRDDVPLRRRGDARPARPALHLRLPAARDLLPGFRAGMHNVALDEQRHIGFGVKLLRDLALEDPEVPGRGGRACCAPSPRSRSPSSCRPAGTRATSSASASRSSRSTRRARSRSRPSSAPPACRSRSCPGRRSCRWT